MFTGRTIVGIIAGAAIIGIGVAALVTSIGVQTLDLDETIATGESLPYKITAPAGSVQVMNVTGDRFDIELAGPPNGLEIPEKGHEGEARLHWTHVEDGETNLSIRNTGSGEIGVSARLSITTDPILFAYHFIVITAGVIIIGFSLGFSVRRPKGF